MGLTKELFIQIQQETYGLKVDIQQPKKEQPQLNIEQSVKFLLAMLYHSEFEVIEGVNQHPHGATFDEWLKQRNLVNDIY